MREFLLMSGYQPRHGVYHPDQEELKQQKRRTGLLHAGNPEDLVVFDQAAEPSFLVRMDWNEEEDREELLFPEKEEKENEAISHDPAAVSIQPKRKRRFMTIFFGCMFLIAVFFLLNHRAVPSEPKQQAVVSLKTMPAKLHKMWSANKSLNSDYLGQIVFDSGLADLAIVQADDVYQEDGTMYEFYTQDGIRVNDPEDYSGNDVYIWSDWKSHDYDGYAKDGAVFMDYRNSLSDQNLILYGHHIARDFDRNGDKEFTPLDLLLQEENLEKNRLLKLILEHEIREYEVARVFLIDTYDEDQVQIVRTDFGHDLSGADDPAFFENYLTLIDSLEEYEIPGKLSASDRFLTLVTCIEHQPRYREIVLCKETGVECYE